MDKENDNPSTGQKRAGALLYPPKKRPSRTDPVVRYGKHFGRTICAVTDILVLITNGLNRLGDIDEGTSIEELTAEERREHDIFLTLLKLVPKLDERIVDGTTEEISHVAAMKGVNTARADDTKGLKSAIIDWITPKGQSLSPPLARNIKSDRGFQHERTGKLLCPAAWNWSDEKTQAGLRSGELAVPGEHWPLFVYENYAYDSERPFDGLFRSTLLVCAYKHIFTSPSSVDQEPRATRSGNARIHGMSEVTLASIAYVATQVRFALSSTSTFSRTDYVTDSERFYTSVMQLFTDVRARGRINELKLWWNRKIFPGGSMATIPVLTDTPLARIHAQLESEAKAAEGAGEVTEGTEEGSEHQ